jgi:flagellar basal-body rod protein FlgG
MNGAFEVGAVALRSQQRALEALAHNVSNVNTPGFKRDDVQFAEIVNGPSAAPATETQALAFEAAPASGGVRMTTRATISEQGELRAGSKMDIAIDGQGFIELMGPDGRSLLWRGGRLSVDRNGYLAAAGGATLRTLITIPDDLSDLAIGRDGVVSGKDPAGAHVELGQIMLVRVESDAELDRLDSGLFRVKEDARTIEAVPGEDGAGTIAQGMIEGSNVEMTAAMVEMLMLQRAYAATAQVVQAADQIASITNNLKR